MECDYILHVSRPVSKDRILGYRYHETNESCSYPQTIPMQHYVPGHPPISRKRTHLVYPNNRNNSDIVRLSKNSNSQFQSLTRNDMSNTRWQDDYGLVDVLNRSAIQLRCWGGPSRGIVRGILGSLAITFVLTPVSRICLLRIRRFCR
jgi:hypothetical protein